ncbi:MAG: VWA domain-containing protein [Ardenticatenales bacterium]
MTFARPMALWLLALVPAAAALLWWTARARAAAVARLGDPALIARLSPAVDGSARRVRDVLWPVALGCAVIALARPQWGRAVQVVQQQGNQIIVVLDVSTSMLAEDTKPNRLARAKLEIGRLMEQLDGDDVGLVLFAGASFVQLPLTADYATARGFLDAAKPAVISRPGTEIADALRTALAAFDMRRAGGKAILLITDGEDHAADPLAAANEARDAQVRIFAIGYGSPDGERVPQLDADGNAIGWKTDANGQPVISRLDEKTLQALAGATGGTYWRAGAAGGAIDSLLQALAGMQKGTSEGRLETSRVERFQLFLLAAVALMLAAEALARLGRRRVVRPLAALLALALILPTTAGCSRQAALDVRAGNTALAAGDDKGALALYSSAAEAAPERPEPAYDQGVARLAGGDFSGARRDLERALIGARGALSAFTWYNLGTAALMAGELDVAVDALSEALRLTPDDAEAKRNLELALAARNAATAEKASKESQEEQGQDGQPSKDGQQQSGQDQGKDQQPGSGDQQGSPTAGQGAGAGTPTPSASGTPPGGAGAQADAAGTATAQAMANPSPAAGGDKPNGTPASGQGGGKGGGKAVQMTPEEARRLLEAIGGRARSLGEVLRMRLMAPGNPPVEDW